MANPFAVTFADPVKGSLDVERDLSTLATARENRAEMALRQQEVGLRLAELQANAPLREAERQRMLGLYKDEGEAPAARLPGSQFNVAAPGAAPQVPGGQPVEGGLPSWLTGRESGGNFGAVNADTGAAGRGQFMESRLADAKRAGVVPANMTLDQFRADSTAQVRVEQWHVSDIGNFITRNQLDQYVGRTVAGIPITPNGMLAVAHLGGSTGLKKFLETGGQYNPADANGTRLSDYMLLGARAQGVMPQAQARPAAQLPAGALGEGFLRSPAGVPMTAPEADLQPTTGAPAQAGLSQTGTAQTPSGVTVQVPGVPGASPMVDSSGFFPGTEPIPGGWQMTGPLEALQQGALALRTSTPRSPPVAPTPVATTGGAMYAAPSQLTLGGATAIVPAGISPAMGGGTPLGGAISPTSMAAQSQGLLTPRPTAAPAGAPAAQAALPATIPGLTVAGPAMLGLQQVQEQRAQLQRQYDRVRLAPPGERAALRAQIEAQNNALVQQERNYQVDIAVGQLSMGQWQPISNILQQMYGVQVRPVESGGRVAGYELMQSGRAVARLTPEQLGSQARLGLSQTFAQQEAARNKALYDANIEGIKEALKAKATAAAKIAEAEATARTRGFSQVQKRDDGSVIAINPSTGEGFIYRQVPVPGGKKGETRDEIVQLRANVPVQ